MSQLTPRQIYEQSESIAKCIDITAAHVAFGGGAFWQREESRVGPQLAPLQTSAAELELIAKDLLIDGVAKADLEVSNKKIQLRHLGPGKGSFGKVVEFNYLERGGLLQDSRSPLGRAAINYETGRAIDAWLKLNPTRAASLGRQMDSRSTETALGFPAAVLDQHSINSLTGSDLNLILWSTPHETDNLRHFIRYVLLSEVDGYDWEWNVSFENRGDMQARYGELFQVFRRFGLDLSKLRDYEREVIEIGVGANLLPKRYLEEFRKAYGI